MAISAEYVGVDNGGMTRAGNLIAIPPATGRGPQPRTSDTRRTTTVTDVARARTALRELKPRRERFAHLKRMYD